MCVCVCVYVCVCVWMRSSGGHAVFVSSCSVVVASASMVVQSNGLTAFTFISLHFPHLVIRVARIPRSPQLPHFPTSSSASPTSPTSPSCSYESRGSPGPGAYSPSSNPRGYSGKDLKMLDAGTPTAFGSGSPRSAHGTPKAAHSRDLWKAPNTPGPGSYAASNSPNHPVVSQVVSQDALLADTSATSLDRSSAGKGSKRLV